MPRLPTGRPARLLSSSGCTFLSFNDARVRWRNRASTAPLSNGTARDRARWTPIATDDKLKRKILIAVAPLRQALGTASCSRQHLHSVLMHSGKHTFGCSTTVSNLRHAHHTVMRMSVQPLTCSACLQAFETASKRLIQCAQPMCCHSFLSNRCHRVSGLFTSLELELNLQQSNHNVREQLTPSPNITLLRSKVHSLALSIESKLSR